MTDTRVERLYLAEISDYEALRETSALGASEPVVVKAQTGLFFQTGVPEVNRGNLRQFIALMVSKDTGRDIALPLYYLNAYPLEKEDCTCTDEHDEGCPTTGWFYDESNFEDEDCYWAARGEVVAWAELPTASSIRSALASPPASPVVTDAMVMRMLREWFGSERYSRDYEYLDAQQGPKMRAALTAALSQGEQGE